MNYSFDPNLGEGLCIFTSFHFPDSGLYLSNGFDFYFDLLWMAWHWKPAIASHDAPCFMLYYHCVRDISWSLLFSTRVMNIAVLDVYGFQTCFGSAASAFENIELADIHCALKKNFSVTLKGYICFTDLSRTTPDVVNRTFGNRTQSNPIARVG